MNEEVKTKTYQAIDTVTDDSVLRMLAEDVQYDIGCFLKEGNIGKAIIVSKTYQNEAF